jgi:Flp pilus assembly protein TadD
MSFLKQMAAFPLRMAAETASLLSFVDATGLWSACYKLSGEAEDGRQLLMRSMRRHGIEGALKLGQEILERSEDCEIAAAMAGFYYSRGDFASAARFVETAKQRGYKNGGMLLFIELMLSHRVNGFDKEAIIEQMLQRNDLPGLHTAAALIAKAELFVRLGRLDEAERMADRVLAVEENWCARFINWHICVARGREDEGARHLEAARRMMPDTMFRMNLATSWLELGRKEEAMELLSSLDLDEGSLEKLQGTVGELAQSAEFAAFCAGRAK